MINIKIKKKLDYIIFISLILIILLILKMIDIHSYYYKIPDVKWPFINLKDENNKNINMLCIRGILNDKEKLQFLDYINRGIKFIGCSSYLSFPKECENIHGDCHKDGIYKIEGKDIEEYVLGWCHCFRDPDKYIKHNIPRILISEFTKTDNGLLESVTSPDHLLKSYPSLFIASTTIVEPSV